MEGLGVAVLALTQGVDLHLPGIAMAEFKQGQQVSAGGDAEIHPFHHHVGEERDHHLRGKPSELFPYFRNEGRQELGRLFFKPQSETQVQGLYDGAVVQAHKVAEGIAAVHNQREYIEVSAGSVDYHRLGIVLLKRVHLLPVLLRLLEVEL